MNRAPIHGSSLPSHLRQVADSVNSIIDSISTGSVTLTNSTTTTTVSDMYCGTDSIVILTPTTSDAASENYYISSVDKEEFVITHSNDTTTRTFNYLVIG